MRFASRSKAMRASGVSSRRYSTAGSGKERKMRPLKDLLNRTGDASLPENMQTTSSIEPVDEGLCTLCGRQSICGGLGYVRYDLPVDHPQFGQLFRCPNGTADPQRVDRLRKLGNLDAFADKTFETFTTDLPGLTKTQAQS